MAPILFAPAKTVSVTKKAVLTVVTSALITTAVAMSFHMYRVVIAMLYIAKKFASSHLPPPPKKETLEKGIKINSKRDATESFKMNNRLPLLVAILTILRSVVLATAAIYATRWIVRRVVRVKPNHACYTRTFFTGTVAEFRGPCRFVQFPFWRSVISPKYTVDPTLPSIMIDQIPVHGSMRTVHTNGARTVIISCTYRLRPDAAPADIVAALPALGVAVHDLLLSQMPLDTAIGSMIIIDPIKAGPGVDDGAFHPHCHVCLERKVAQVRAKAALESGFTRVERAVAARSDWCTPHEPVADSTPTPAK